MPTLVLLWAALLAFAWQGVVTQAHRHIDATTVFGHSAASIDNSPSEQQSPVDSPAGCALCREAGHAGPLLVPVAPALHAPLAVRLAEVALPLQQQRSFERSHRWQSRAPPIPLRA